MSSKRILLTLLLIAALLAPVIAACGPTEEPTAPVAEATQPPEAEDLLDEVKAAGKLVVSSDPNYAPQSYLNEAGELVGFDIDVAKEVADRLGVEVEFTTPDWDLITGGNWGGRWDISIGSMTATEQRAEVLWFTDSYYYVPASFAVHKDNTTIQSPSDLSGKKLGLGTATTYEDYLNGVLSMLSGRIVYDPPSGITVAPYGTDQEAIQDLALGDGVRLDAVMSAQPTIQGAIEEGVSIKEIGTPAFYEGLVFALDKSRGPSDKMLAELNNIVAAMHSDGTLTELAAPYYPVDYTKIIEPGEAPPAGANRGAGGTVNILYWQAVSTLNAYLSGGTKDIEAASLITEPLGRYDETGKMWPWLAAEIPTVENGGVSEDLTSITWTLKEGLLWSDGTPVTAEDVVFSWEYCLHPDMGCNSLSWFAGVETVEALDEVTVKITFDAPKPYPYGPFVGAETPIIQKAQFQDCMGARAQECTEQNFAPVGTGPYKVVEFRANDVVIYEINELYRDPNKPYFSEVVFKGGGDAASAARAVLETGEADYAWNVQVEKQILEQMEAAGIGKVVPAYATGVERIMINFTNPDPALGDKRSVWSEDDPNPHPFLSDYNVRRALSLAIDRNVIAEQLYGEAAGKATCNVLPAPDIYVSTANEECLVQDIDEANRLLDEAGWVPGADGIREKDGVRLSILYQTSTNSLRQSEQALVKQWWEEIGVETELRNIDSAVYFGGDPASPDTYGKFYADVQMYTNDFSGTDPEAYMANWLCEEVSGPDNQWLGNNIPRWCNADYEALVEQMSQTADLEERAALAKAMNDMLMQNYVMLPLVHRGSPSAVANSLQNVKVNAWDSELWNIADWTRAEE
jgi:peptide/nickel transport system substrate-binding protein